MRIVTTTSLNAVDTTTSSNGASEDSSQWYMASAQAVIVTAGTGTLKVQFSNDPVNVLGGPTHWSDVPSATVATTGAGTYGIGKFDSCYNYLRCVYTATSGTGTITAVIRGAGF